MQAQLPQQRLMTRPVMDQESNAALPRGSKPKARAASPARSKAPAPRRPSTTVKETSKGKKLRDPSPFGLEAATPPPESPPSRVPSHSKGKGGSQPKPRANSRSQFAVAPAPPESDDEGSGRLENKTEADMVRRLKLIAAITERNKRCDHIKYNLETLQMIWSVKPKTTAASSKAKPSAQTSLHKGINAFGSMDLDDSALRKSSSRASKDTRNQSETRSSVPRHSTPITTARAVTSRVVPAGHRPSPVQSGMVAHFRNTSAMSSRSSSPYVRSDHNLASDFDASVADDMDFAAEPSEPGTGKPRRSDYQGTYLEIIDATFVAACAHLVTEGFFPGRQAMDKLINSCWKTAARRIGVDPASARYSITKNQWTITRHRIHSYQGWLKVKIVKALQAGYDLGEDDDTIKERADALLPHGFYTKPDSPPGKGLYQHPYIEKAINGAFFTIKPKSTPIGVSYAGMFGGDDGMPLHTVALVCAIIEWGLKQHKAGADICAMMQGKTVEKIYNTHLRTLVQFESINGELADIMRHQWYISGCKHSKTDGSKSANQAGLPQASSMPLILPEKPSKQAQLAVTGALKRLNRGMIHAPPAADESGGFDDVPSSGESDHNKAFTIDNSPRKTHKTHKSSNGFQDEGAPLPGPKARPRPVWVTPRRDPSEGEEDEGADRTGLDCDEEREEDEVANWSKQPGLGHAKGVGVGKGAGAGKDADRGKGSGAGKGLGKGTERGEATSAGKGSGAGKGTGGDMGGNDAEKMDREEQEQDDEDRELEEEVRREVLRRKAERKALAGLAQHAPILASKPGITPPARRNGNSKPPSGGSHCRTPSTSGPASRKRDLHDVDADFDGDWEEGQARRKRPHRG